MRHFVITSVVTGSSLVAAAASAQQLQYGTGPAPAPTYTPAPVQPAPNVPAPAQPPSAPPQYGQPAPIQGAQPAPQPQPQPQTPPQYGQPAPQPPPQPPPQYAPPQQQPQYGQPQQPQQYGQPQQSGYGTPQPSYGGGTQPAEMSPPIADAGAAWRPSNAKFIIAGERLMGVSSIAGTLSPSGGTSVDGSALMVNLLWANSSVRIAGVSAINPYAMPMLTFHGVVGGGVTIGGGIGYASTAGSHDVGDGTTVDDPTFTAVAVAPRVGYLVSTSPTFGIWMKGGITYSSQTREFNIPASADCSTGTCVTVPATTGSTSISGIALSIDPMLVLSPVPHVGILLGPVLDIGLSGTITDEGGGPTVDTDLKLSNFGVAAGLALLI